MHVYTSLQCYFDYNVNATGQPSDYPLCSAELTADMKSAKDTPTCFRRGRPLQVATSSAKPARITSIDVATNVIYMYSETCL